jgi:hypothetical protein
MPATLPDLEPISWLIKYHTNRARFLDELDPDRKMVAAEILQSATQLEQTTGWDGETLVQCLGCPATTVGEFRKLEEGRLKISRDYLGLLQTLAALVETEIDKRMLLLGYGTIYRRADRDVERVERAFKDPATFSAFDYLQLGEVQTALDTAMGRLDPEFGPKGRNPFDGLPTVHISTARLDVLIDGDQSELDTLGTSVLIGRMRSHIDGCEGCEAAYRYRQEQLAKGETFPSQGA